MNNPPTILPAPNSTETRIHLVALKQLHDPLLSDMGTIAICGAKTVSLQDLRTYRSYVEDPITKIAPERFCARCAKKVPFEDVWEPAKTFWRVWETAVMKDEEDTKSLRQVYLHELLSGDHLDHAQEFVDWINAHSDHKASLVVKDNTYSAKLWIIIEKVGPFDIPYYEGRMEFYSAPIPSDKQQRRHTDNHYRIFCDILNGTLPYEVTDE